MTEAAEHRLTAARPCADADTADEAQWFCAVYSLLRSTYVRSRRAHSMYLVECAPSDAASASMDGRGGSAILTEMEKHLGTEVLFRRAFFKRLVLLCAHGLRWPLFRQPSGTVAIGFKPRCRTRSDGISIRTVQRLRIPDDVIAALVLPMIGDIWWGASKATKTHLQLQQGEERCYTVNLPYPRRLLRKWLPFGQTFFLFALEEPALIEWPCAGTGARIHTRDIWNVVHFFRHLRSHEERSKCEIVHIYGLGDVLV